MDSAGGNPILKQTPPRPIVLGALVCFVMLSGACGTPIVPFILNVAVDAGISLCATKGGEFLSKEFDKVMDNFMEKVGSPKHNKADAQAADHQHPALLIDPHNPNKAVALGFTEINYGGSHGAQHGTAKIQNANFIKKDGAWILSPDDRENALKQLEQGLQ